MTYDEAVKLSFELTKEMRRRAWDAEVPAKYPDGLFLHHIPHRDKRATDWYIVESE